ncbi:2-dehydro-3-deoxygalactonokinase [Frigidibacter sp. ROC022]|uniref:2-dehydro-3-deoxygalactonokinase n=1 Tax=Frigidibacter sp. ROC022 TaxID=2971796 RepID=UPI00215AE7A6|nr:2-dehydro-3-deoxygalactonokinase [Frigidibacter sp. ROC022]MCR8724638.1 2-dehydro-3-deoxygalactonokinase [Frigidibacter sp. ROC022]
MTATTVIAGSWGKGGLDLAAIDGRTAEVQARHHCPTGLAEARGRHADVLTEGCGAWLARYPDAPVLLSGMVGGRGNWVETDYVPCPFEIADLVSRAERVEAAGHSVTIVPGGSVRRQGIDCDVMRGEEVQVLGALAVAGIDSAAFCIPGTNAKWARAERGRMTGFATYVTGDLYDHLRNRSLVGALAEGEGFDAAAFTAGLDRVAGLGLSNAAFTARAAVLLERLKPEDVGAYLSGVVIGAEITDAARFRDQDRVLLIAGGGAAERYGLALRHRGIAHEVIDASAARLAGLAALARAIPG